MCDTRTRVRVKRDGLFGFGCTFYIPIQLEDGTWDFVSSGLPPEPWWEGHVVATAHHGCLVVVVDGPMPKGTVNWVQAGFADHIKSLILAANVDESQTVRLVYPSTDSVEYL